MRRQCWRLVVPLALLAAAHSPRAIGGEMPAGPDAFAPTRPDPVADAKALAATIDRLLAAKWAAAKVEPAPPADDAEFLRRAYLDLTGKIPAASEARAFLADPAPDKRQRLVERLLAGPGYVAHMTTTWKGLLLPEAGANAFVAYSGTDFDVWLGKRFAEGAGYDKVVREVLTVELPRRGEFYDPFNRNGKPSTPFAYAAAKDGKPENLAAGAARLFLGVRIECAQCHDHPFARWKREQFWGLAAFFSGVKREGNDDFFQVRELPDRREIAIPGSERVIQASFLDGSEPEWKWKENPRATLANWITSPKNPYFARAAANRVWSQLFGTGLVDPVDDMDKENAPSHPELLDELARQFAAHDFDLKFLARAITYSDAYGLSSGGYSPGQDDPRLFARAAIRGMTPQQLYDSFVQATGLRREKDLPFFFLAQSPRKDFLERFAAQDAKPTEFQTSILQALTLMNGRLAADATSLERGGTLPAVADSFFLDTAGKVEALYLAALSRPPRPDERERMVEYVDRGGPTLNPKKALSDVFWALLNSAEFVLNH
jgi:hypothetical protein